jgi:hypothetical protein
MTQSAIVVQDCGCIALPEEVAREIGMMPGKALAVSIDKGSRSITLTAAADALIGGIPDLTACPIKP